MAISRRRPKADPPADLLDLPLSSKDPAAGDSTTGDPAAGDLAIGGPSGRAPHRPIVKKRLGDLDAIDSLDRRRRPGGRRIRWLWLILLLAVPLGALVGFFLRSDPPVAALSTDLLDFGEVRLGTTGGEQTIRVSNQGEKLLRLEAAVLAGEAANEFRIAGDDCGGREIAALADCGVRLTFAPTGRGARRARIRLDSNAPSGTQTVPLIGVGVTPELSVEPSHLDLGSQGVGGTGASADLRLGNRGTAALQLGRIELAGPATGDFRRVADGCSSRSLAPGERCTVRFAFAPREPGDRHAELRIESDAGAPVEVKLTGRAVLRQPLLRLEPEALDFEPRLVGEASPPRPLELANDGNGPLTLRGIELAGDAAVAYDLSTQSCLEQPVPAGGACALEIIFQPAAEGAARAFLQIDSDATAEPHLLPLSGTGIAPRLSVDPGRVSFGDVAVRSSSALRSLAVKSSGTAELRIGAVSVTGADAGSFSAEGCSGAVVAPAAECSLEIRFRPQRAGPHRADLILEHNAGSGRTRLPLNGLGVTARLSLDSSRIDFGEVPAGTTARRPLVLRNAGRSDLKILRLRLTGAGADFELDAARCASATLAPGTSCSVGVVYRPASAGSRGLQLVIDHTAGEPRTVPITATGTPPAEPQ